MGGSRGTMGVSPLAMRRGVTACAVSPSSLKAGLMTSTVDPSKVMQRQSNAIPS